MNSSGKSGKSGKKLSLQKEKINNICCDESGCVLLPPRANEDFENKSPYAHFNVRDFSQPASDVF